MERKSKRIKAKPLPTRKLISNTTNIIMPTPWGGAGDEKLIEYLISNMHMLCKKARFFKLYKLFKAKTLLLDATWLEDTGWKPILSLQQLQYLVLGTQLSSSSHSYSLNDTNPC
jgi:hypothetical protein